MPTRRPTPVAHLVARLASLVVAGLLLASCSPVTEDAASDPADSNSATSTTAATTARPSAAATDDGEASASESSTPAASDDASSADREFPDVLEVELTASGDTWSVAATISSPYDTPDRYADAFRVLAPDGTELGVRELLHDHGAEQPFTRSLDDVAIPDEVDQVTVEGRDLANGWGGATVTVPVPR